MKNISIVLLNWKHKNETLECLKNLTTIEVPKNIQLSFIIVDNNSQDGSVEDFESFQCQFPLTVLSNSVNYGYAGGNNVGMKHAVMNDADFVLVMNNDMYVDKMFLKELLLPFQSGKKIAITSPKIYFAANHEFHKDRYTKTDLGNVFWYAGGTIDWNNVMGKNRGVDEVDNGQYEKEELIEFATGACFLVSREALLQVGFFDERYFMYLEDLDFSVRMKSKNFKIVYVPRAKLWHKVSSSSGIGSNLNDYFISRNRLLFGYKYSSNRTRFALFRESVKHISRGRQWQKKGVFDYYKRKLNKGSWIN